MPITRSLKAGSALFALAAAAGTMAALGTTGVATASQVHRSAVEAKRSGVEDKRPAAGDHRSGADTRSASNGGQKSSCSSTVHTYAFPRAPRSFGAANAGSVTIAPVNGHTIRVAGITRSKGWTSYVDTRRGDSVDVYFRQGTHKVELEAEITDAGLLKVTVTKSSTGSDC